MAKTYKHRKNVYEDGFKTRRQKDAETKSSKKKYKTNKVLDFEDLDYEYLR